MSLLPSATEIVGGLGLEGHLVGVSHECDVAPTAERLRAVLEAGCERVTTSDIDPHALPQGEIDRRVKEALETGGDGALYGVDAAAVARAAPTVLLTQTLCGVCAPATSAVEAVLAASNVEPVVANLEPTTIDDVAESFKSVARACGVPERGEDLVAKFYAHLDRVRRAAEAASSSRPRVLLLEWLDPPFDGGHWVPEQIEAAGCEPARNAAGGRSTGMSWDEVEAEDADVVLIACCGFDLRRNVSDAVAHAPALSKLRAAREGRVYAVDGNRYLRGRRSRWRPGALWWRGARTGRWSSPRRTCPKRAWAGVASTSPLRLARVAPRRLAMRRSRRMRGSPQQARAAAVTGSGGAGGDGDLAAAASPRRPTAKAGRRRTPQPSPPARRRTTTRRRATPSSPRSRTSAAASAAAAAAATAASTMPMSATRHARSRGRRGSSRRRPMSRPRPCCSGAAARTRSSRCENSSPTSPSPRSFY